MNTILINCSCGREFRWKPVQKYNSTIKPKAPTQCNICKNAEILKGYKSTREKKQPKSKKYVANSKIVIQTPKCSGKKVTKKPRKKNINKLLDSAWSKLVKLEWGNKCAVCGNRRSLNSHHIYSRAKKSVCWDTINGICLCVKHHIGTEFSAHKTPTDFTFWLMEKKGKAWLMKLRIKSNSTAHYHEFEKEIMLKELNKRIKEY